MVDFDVNALGQAIDTSWGRSSTPKTATYSVKFTLSGTLLTASYASIVNFASPVNLAELKKKYSSESETVIDSTLKNVKSTYKSLSGKTLKLKEHSKTDDVEIIGLAIHNPKRTAYYRKKIVFEVS